MSVCFDKRSLDFRSSDAIYVRISPISLWSIALYNMEYYIVHGSKDQNDSKLKLTLERVS